MVGGGSGKVTNIFYAWSVFFVGIKHVYYTLGKVLGVAYPRHQSCFLMDSVKQDCACCIIVEVSKVAYSCGTYHCDSKTPNIVLFEAVLGTIVLHDVRSHKLWAYRAL